jgi:hypothetical protein
MKVRSRGARVGRGGAIAGISVVIAAFSHVAGGGSNPGVLGVVLAMTFAVLSCIALAGRALSVGRLTLSVALSQFVFHLLFNLGADLPVGAASHGSVGMLGMVMSGGATQTLPSVGPGAAASVGGMDGMSDARMWLGHAVAAALTIAVLLHGERAALTLGRLAGARLARTVDVVGALPAALPVARHRVALVLADRRGVRLLEVLLAARPRRGPPVVA